MYRVAKGINLKIREESKDKPEKANNKRYSKLVSEIHIEILIYLFVSTFCFEIVKWCRILQEKGHWASAGGNSLGNSVGWATFLSS